MKRISIQQLAEVIKAAPASAAAGSICGVSVDSRTIRPGECFFALGGENYDGADFVSESLDKGAGCAVVGRDINISRFTTGAVLKVDSPLEALGDLAAQYRRRAGFKVVAVTGSVGKTTTRRIIYHFLSRRLRCHQAPKNFNNHIGLSLTLLGARENDEVVVAELASNRPGEIGRLSRIAAPDTAVVTNVYPVHLEGLGDIETIAEEKSSVAEGLVSNGRLIINGDFPKLVEACREKGLSFTTFGTKRTCDIRAGNIICEPTASSFTIDGRKIHLPLAGEGNVSNALAAWAVCRDFGIAIDEFAAALEELKPVSMRAEILQTGALTVINDCYNANPASMKNALGILGKMRSNKDRRLVFICGDMAELGRHSRILHQQLGRQIALAGVELVIAVGKLAATAAAAAKKDAEHRLVVKTFEDTPSACNNLKRLIRENDIVLVKASRTAELNGAVDKLKQLFS